MKSTFLRLALAGAFAVLPACTGAHKKIVEQDPNPGFNRYLQDPNAPQTRVNENPDPSPAPAPTTTDTTPPPKTDPGATAPPAGGPPTPPPPASQYPYGKPVPGKKGFVTSPYDDKAGMIDVRDYTPGTKVRDPYTNKIFLVP